MASKAQMADSRVAVKWIAFLLVIAAAVGTAGILIEPVLGYSGLLVAAMFGLTVALGAASLVALCGAADAHWYRPFAKVPMEIAATIPVPVIPLAIVLAFGIEAIYPWAQAEVVNHSHLLQEKAIWLNVPFFLVRAVFVLVIWMGLIGLLRSRVASANDRTGWSRVRVVSALFIVALAGTLSIASWDWTMSLEPEWFSTMWAVYAFSGAFPAGIAAVTILVITLDRKGLLPHSLTDAQRHDLGKLLFAFSSFWAYIWFCQYMLIWYANVPEEATWFAHRMTGSWATLFWLNPVLNWVIPFVALLSARAKRDPGFLVQVSMVVLAGHWLDTYMMIAPAVGDSSQPMFALNATIAVVLGMWLFLQYRLRRDQAA